MAGIHIQIAPSEQLIFIEWERIAAANVFYLEFYKNIKAQARIFFIQIFAIIFESAVLSSN